MDRAVAASPSAAAPSPSINRSRIVRPLTAVASRIRGSTASWSPARPAKANIRRSRVCLAPPAIADRYDARLARSKDPGATRAANTDASRLLLEYGRIESPPSAVW